jgi:hypothetical protein
MSAVFSGAEKWEENRHVELSIESKALYDYLFDTADIAGFKPVSYRLWSTYTGLSVKEIKTCLKELKEWVIIENNLAWLKDHLKFNRNDRIHTKNNALKKVRQTYRANKNHKAAFQYYSNLLDSTLLYSTEPLKKGIKFHKAAGGTKPIMEAGDVLKIMKRGIK